MNGTIRTLSAFALVCAASLPLQAQELKGDAFAGSQKNALCIGCHGIQGFHTAFPETYQVPKLSGQGAKYISTALHAYKSGQRKHPSMRTMANSLSEQDMADLAAYYASTGSGTTVAATPQPGSAAAEALVTKGGCPACHGVNFSKPVDPNYPKIAGQHGDYLYMALTNMMAFTPNDVVPLTARAKIFMGIQGLSGFVILALVIGRSVNILA